MIFQATLRTASPTKPGPFRLGFWTAILTAIAAGVALGMGVLTPARAGPFCNVGTCITYPYTDAAAFVPYDYVWMYPAFFMALLFPVLIICIHHFAAPDKKIFSQIALLFAALSATALAADYFIQLAVIQPSFLLGEVEGLALWSEYNPHGVFIALEDLGYLMMSVAFLFAALVFDGRTTLERALRWLFIIAFGLTIGALGVLVLMFGMFVEYRFEVVAIVITWLALIVCGILLSVLFNRSNLLEG